MVNVPEITPPDHKEAFSIREYLKAKIVREVEKLAGDLLVRLKDAGHPYALLLMASPLTTASVGGETQLSSTIGAALSGLSSGGGIPARGDSDYEEILFKEMNDALVPYLSSAFVTGFISSNPGLASASVGMGAVARGMVAFRANEFGLSSINFAGASSQFGSQASFFPEHAVLAQQMVVAGGMLATQQGIEFDLGNGADESKRNPVISERMIAHGPIQISIHSHERQQFIVKLGGEALSTVDTGELIGIIHVNRFPDFYSQLEPMARARAIFGALSELFSILEFPEKTSSRFALSEQDVSVLQQIGPKLHLIGISHLVRSLERRGIPCWGIDDLPAVMRLFHRLDSSLVAKAFGSGDLQRFSSEKIRVAYIGPKQRRAYLFRTYSRRSN